MLVPEGSRYLGGGVRTRTPAERREDAELAAGLDEIAEMLEQLAACSEVVSPDVRGRAAALAVEIRAKAREVEDGEEVRC